MYQYFSISALAPDSAIHSIQLYTQISLNYIHTVHNARMAQHATRPERGCGARPFQRGSSDTVGKFKKWRCDVMRMPERERDRSDR